MRDDNDESVLFMPSAFHTIWNEYERSAHQLWCNEFEYEFSLTMPTMPTTTKLQLHQHIPWFKSKIVKIELEDAQKEQVRVSSSADPSLSVLNLLAKMVRSSKATKHHAVV